MSKVSVIIAAYNVEKYIDHTVNSVIGQSFRDIEIIIVDDCSTDSTFEKVQRLAAQDNRVKVVRHEVNRSSMIARKTGVEHATGDYVMFLDGDDLYTRDACEKVVEALKKNKTDILQFSVAIFNDDGIVDDDDPNAYGMYQYLKYVKSRIVSISDGSLLSKEKNLGKQNYNFVTKVYKRELALKVFDHIPSNHLNMAEDLLLSYIAFFFASSYDYLDERIYQYRFGAGISGTNMINDAKLDALSKSWFVYKYLYEWTSKQGKLKECAFVLDRIKLQMLGNIADTLLYKANNRQYDRFIELVKRYGNEAEIVLALASLIYTVEAIRPDRAAQICSQIKMFQSTKTQAKTIGVYYYRMHNGGIENVMSIVTDLWVKNGYNVVLFTDQAPTKEDYSLNPKIKRVVLPAISDSSLDTLEKRIFAFQKSILEYNIDMMVYNAWVNPYLVLDELIIKACNVKLIVHTHGVFCSNVISTDHSAAYNSVTLGKSYVLADLVVALTDVDLAWWRSLGLRAEKTVNPIRLSLDTEPAKLNGKNIICSGRIDSMQKQTLHAVQIAELVKKKIPDVTLTLIGGCDEREYQRQIEDYIKDHGLENTVHMVGYTQDVLSYYKNADIMLCTSKFEGFSLSLTEGKVCGLPLVCYYLSNWDMARDPKGMVNIPQGDIYAAADAIVEILQNDELKKQMGKQAKESAIELYRIDLAKHWKSIFDQTLLPFQRTDPLRKSPLEATSDIVMEFYAQGILNRENVPCVTSTNDYQQVVQILNGLAESESYRLGMFLTAIPRKIKRWLKKERK